MRRVLVLFLLITLKGYAAADPPSPNPSPPAPSEGPPAPAAAAPAPAAAPVPPPPPLSLEQTADAVLAAVTANDEAALKAIAAKDDPDPWLVADELIRRGQLEPAGAFAGAAPRTDVERLPAYVAARRGRSDEAPLRKALAAADAALVAGESARAITLLAGLTAVDDLLAVRLEYARAQGYCGVKRLADCVGAALAAGRRARRVGWLTAAARSLRDSGTAAETRSDFRGALVAWQEHLEVAEKHGDREGAALALLHIGRMHDSLGAYPEALKKLDLALDLNRELGNRKGVVDTLGAIGDTHWALGDFSRAMDTLQEALRLAEELGDRGGTAAVLGSIGLVYEALDDLPKAVEFTERSMQLKEDLGDRAGVARLLNNLGGIQTRLREFSRALASYERALPIEDGLGDREAAATTLWSIGNVYRFLKDYPRAVETQREALARAEALGARYLTLYALWGLSVAHLGNGDPSASAASARRAAELLTRFASGLGDEQGARAREQFSHVFGIGVTAAAELGDASEAAFFLETGRAAVLLEALGGGAAIRSVAISESLRIAEDKARAAESIAARNLGATVERGNLAEIGAARKQLDAAQAGVVASFERIQREAKAAANLIYPKADSLAAITARLNDGEAIVLYGVFLKRSYALVATSKAARIVELAAPTEVDDACASADWAKLKTLVAAPVALGSGVRRVFVSPAGALCAAPFCLLMPDQEVVYLPSGTTYGVLLDEAGKRGEGVLALGDPDYLTNVDPQEVARHRGGLGLLPLPGTREEAKAVGDVLLLGADASERALLTKLAFKKRWHAVHLACHGLVNAGSPLLSSLALSKGDFMTVAEVLRTRIPADLVVLSACETARGRIYEAEGVVGFVRAILFAGAPRVIVSLWKVDDEATRALMTKFYALWNPKSGMRGVPAATALRQAQQFVAAQEKWSDPRYWAAWQLWGLSD